MRSSWRGAVALGCAVVAAVLWAVDMAVWQPWAQGDFDYAQNNTYWARDLRFSAIVAIGLAVLLAGRGSRVGRRGALALGAAWIAADLLLDRADVAGGGAAAALAIVGGLVAAAATALVATRAQPDSVGGSVPPTVRRPLVLGAAVGAALTPLVAGIQSATDTEAVVMPAAVTLGGLLAILALALALEAAPTRSAGRWVAAGVLAVLAAAGLWLTRTVGPGTLFGGMTVLGVVLLAGAALLAAEWPQGRPDSGRLVLPLVAALIGYPALVVFVFLMTTMTVPVASWFTALGGNVPVNGADSDTLYALIGSVAGYALGWLLLAAEAVVARDPATA